MAESTAFPAREALTICFAHVAYHMNAAFEKRGTGMRSFQVYTPEELDARVGEADVLVVSGLWRDHLIDVASKLRFIQSIGAGYDQFPANKLRDRGIRLASAGGANRNAVSEHAVALILTLTRFIHTGRDNQRKHIWRDMISDVSRREIELSGKTVGIVGMGAIGSRIAKICKALDMTVVATKRNLATAQGPADRLYTPDRLPELLRESDFVVLACALTDQTRGLIDSRALSHMKPTSFLVNVARGAVVNEAALLKALTAGRIAGAGLDVFSEEPLPEDSPFWDLENVAITPHTAGETQLYEESVLDILMENVDRLCRGEQDLRNQVV